MASTYSEWLTAKELAGRLGLSVWTIYSRRAKGRDLPPVWDIGGGRFRFRADEVAAWMQARRVVVDGEAQEGVLGGD